MPKRCFTAFLVTLLLVLLIPYPEIRAALPDGTLQTSGRAETRTVTPAPTPVPTSTPKPTPRPTPKPTPTPKPIPVPTPKPVTQGDRGDEVRLIQTVLYRNGFTQSKPDGIFGPATAEGVALLKQYINTFFNAGEPSDNTVSRRLLDSLADMPGYAGTLRSGDRGLNVTRLQTRLHILGYLFDQPDGVYGANTERAVAYFQTLSGLHSSGVANEETQNALFSDAAAVSDQYVMPYRLVVDISDQKVYACSWSGGKFSTVVRKMACSSGKTDTPTPLGTFTATTGRGARWHYFEKWECWAQYAYYIEGDILFHSVLYDEQDESTLRKSSLSNLGRRASHGCVRLSVEDAKWIWENCPTHTTVIIRE